MDKKELSRTRKDYFAQYMVEAPTPQGVAVRTLWADHISDLTIVFQKRLGNPDFRTALVYFFIEDYTDGSNPVRVFDFHNHELDNEYGYSKLLVSNGGQGEKLP